jgi:hypothetical protein
LLSRNWAPLYAEKIIGRLVADIFPYVGHEPVAEIPGAGVQPDGVHRAAAGNAAEVGRLSG